MYYTVKKKIKINGKEKTLNILHMGDKVPPNGKEYKGVPGKVNQPIEYYTNGKRKENDVIAKAKLGENHIGSYFDENGASKTIVNLNERPRLSWRKDKPPEYESWNGTEWKENKTDKAAFEAKEAKAKDLAELDKKISENMEILTSTDHEIIKLYEESIEENAVIKKRVAARAGIIKLRAEIKSKG